MGFSYNVNVLNQKGSPALYTDTFANRPNFGYAGRLFIANDTSAIYEDTGTAWVLIANVSSGAGTLQQVTTNGNTSNVGISITAGGLSTNSLTDTALTLGSVLFAGAAGLVTQDNAAFFWDDTNNRLGINTTTPGNSLDVHSSGTNPILALNNTAGNQSAIVFSNTGSNKWRIGNSATNTFDFYNTVLALIAYTINGANNGVTFNQNLKIKQGATFYPESGVNAIGTDAGGFFFQLDTKTFSTYFNFNGLTVARSFTFPDATGTIALTSNLASYLPLTGGTLTGALTVNVGGGLPALNIGNSSLSSKTWTLIPTTNGVDSDLVFYYTGTTSGTKVTFGNTGIITLTNALNIQSGNAANFYRADNAIYTSLNDAGSGAANGFILNNTNGEGFHFKNAATSIMRLSSGSNVLINSTTDDTVNKLQVTGSAKITSSAQISNTKISSVSVGTISALGSSTVTIISAKSGNISLGATITITGFENQNNGAIFITANVIGNWAGSSLNKYGIGTIVSNESLGATDYRGYGLLTPTVGASSNAITLTLTNLQASSITNVMVTITENSN